MLNPIRILLERLAERCISLSTRMLATTIESLHISHYVEQHQQLEELAKELESQGLVDLASTVRDQAKRLLANQPVANLSIECPPELSTPLTLDNSGPASRRPNRRTKRVDAEALDSSTHLENATDPGLFFPLNSQPNGPAAEGEQR